MVGKELQRGYPIGFHELSGTGKIKGGLREAGEYNHNGPLRI
jgi:hypothetical protein